LLNHLCERSLRPPLACFLAVFFAMTSSQRNVRDCPRCDRFDFASKMR
jgi:hypothetical protein